MATNVNPDLLNLLSLYRFGAQVSRPTATLPASTHSAIFTVSGRCLVTLIVGEVTTIIQTQTDATKLTAYPTVGSAVDLCATKDITALEVGGKLVPIGTLATALQQANAGAIAGMNLTPFIVAAGTIHLDCGATNTGSIKWDLWYFPLDVGATIVVA